MYQNIEHPRAVCKNIRPAAIPMRYPSLMEPHQITTYIDITGGTDSALDASDVAAQATQH